MDKSSNNDSKFQWKLCIKFDIDKTFSINLTL